MYLCKIKQFNLCFYKLCSLIPMNIDKLIVNCVVDSHMVETRNECVFYVFVVNCVVDNHTVETKYPLPPCAVAVNCVVDNHMVETLFLLAHYGSTPFCVIPS